MMRTNELGLALVAALGLALAGCGDDGGNDAGLGSDAGVSTDGQVASCGSSETLCGTSCVDTDGDPRHCGGCSMACGTGEVCSAGACATVCPDGQQECSGGCFTLAASNTHCGACGNQCAAGEMCSAGECDVSCGAGLTDCNGSCRDTQTDRTNCGGCGVTCGGGEVCAAGACTLSCGSGLVDCNGVCTDTASSRDNCGACGVTCGADELCTANGCELFCASGLEDCNGTCRDTSSDRNHCGGCGVTCGAEEVCTSGACALSCTGFASTECNGVCTSIATDPANCGACGTVCGTGEVCSSGVCTGTAGCSAPNQLCGGVCTSVANDPGNCGTCGTTCAGGTNAVPVCGAGSCGAICQAAYADCDQDLGATGSNGCEVNTNTAITDCGACGNACSLPANAAASCVGGTCGLGACSPGFDNCDNDPATGCEAELALDVMNCGACGVTCTSSQMCSSGTCVTAVPGGESCADTLPIVPGDNSIAWMATTADYLSGVPSCVSVGTVDGPDVVLTYSPSFTGSTEFRIFNKPTSTRWVIIVSDGTCGTLVPELACLSDWSPSEFAGEVSVTAGTTYYLYVADTTSGTLPLSNPFDLRVTEIDCATYTATVASVSPPSGSTTTSLSPGISLDLSLPVSTNTGTISITGNMGTNLTYDLALNPAAVSFANGNTTINVNPGTLPAGEVITVAVSGVLDARCGNVVPAAGWSFTMITPPCAPGMAGMVGNTVNLVPSGISSFTEYYVAADDAPTGYVYSGGTTALWRMPKAGGAGENVTTLAGLTSSHLGYDMAIDGLNIYTLDQTVATTGVLWRISSDGGATWALQDMAVLPSTPGDDFRSVAAYGGRVYMMTHESTSGAATEIWSIDATSATLPAPAVLELSFTDYLECTGLSVDAQYYYTICDDGNEPVVRIDRTTGVVTPITEAFVANATKNAVHVTDRTGDGVADFLYVQTAVEEGYFVCNPGGIGTPYADLLWSIGTGTSNYGLGYEPTNNIVWAIDDDNRDFVQIR